MQLIKKYWKEALILVLVGILIAYFPLTNKDWFWFNRFNSISIKNISTLFKFELIPSLVAIALSKIKIIKIIIYTIAFMSVMLLIKNIINRKNYVLSLMSVFLFFLIKDEALFSGFISPYGFSTNILPIIMILLIIDFLLNDSLYKINKVILFILGFISCIFNVRYSIALFVFLMIQLFNYLAKKEKDVHFNWLIAGSGVGTVLSIIYNLINKNIVFLDISQKIIHELVPNIYNMEFIIVLISISFLLFLSIKVFSTNIGYKKLLTIMSLASILLYSLVRLLSTNDIINYLGFILFEGFSFFILINSNNRIQFKTKVKALFTLKWVYLICLLIGNIDASNMLFIELINIITIILLIDYVLPKNFLSYAWLIISSIILLLNIYLYKGTYDKTMEMNRFIKNNLECSISEIYIPHRYYNSHIKFLLPEDEYEKKEYLTYLHNKYNFPYDEQKFNYTIITEK